MTKRCCECGVEKPLAKFYKHPATSTGTCRIAGGATTAGKTSSAEARSSVPGRSWATQANRRLRLSAHGFSRGGQPRSVNPVRKARHSHDQF